VLALLEKSAQIDDGSGVTQKEHCLQTATRATAPTRSWLWRRSSTMLAGFYDGMNHGATAAEILRRPHVSRET